MKKCFNNFFVIIRMNFFLFAFSVIFFYVYYIRTYHFERLEREMNDDSSLDGGRFDTGAMGDLDPMVNLFYFQKKKLILLYLV